jgi:hypothetical protein
MSWKYQFIRFGEEDNSFIELNEVYYTEGKPTHHCRASVSGETLESIQWVVEQIQKAYILPILTEQDFKS